MREKIWGAALFVLFISFVYLLSQFASTATRIEQSVQQLQPKRTAVEKRHHVVLIAQELDNPYWRKVEEGAKAAATLYKIELKYTGPLRNNQAEQVKLMEKAIAAKVNAIIVQSVDTAKFTPLINKAIGKGIAVITIDTDAPKSERLTYVGTNNEQAGQMLARQVVRFTGGRGKIGIIIGDENAENQKQRLAGFLSIVARYPQLKVADMLPSNISRVKAAQQAEAMLKHDETIDVMVGTSALDAVGILQATQRLGKHVKIFGFDDVTETLRAIQNRQMVATVAQKPYQMGYDSVARLHDYFLGKALPNHSFTKVDVIDATNVEVTP